MSNVIPFPFWRRNNMQIESKPTPEEIKKINEFISMFTSGASVDDIADWVSDQDEKIQLIIEEANDLMLNTLKKVFNSLHENKELFFDNMKGKSPEELAEILLGKK
jgi:hypothetical protein